MAADLDDWSVLEETSSSFQPPPRSLPVQPEFWNRVEEATREIIEHVHPTLVSEDRRRDVIDYMQRLISMTLGCEVHSFGSVPLKTYLPDGDIDLTAFGGPCHEEDLAHQVFTVLEREEHNVGAQFMIKDVQLIRAEVKLVKCLVQNIVVDISFNQLGGICTLCFLEKIDHLIGKDHLFKKSIILIKAWCYYESRILGALHGLISTYALETLVLYIFHLFHSSLDGPLAVLYKFLDYFSKFDWDNYCISLSGPVILSSLSLPEIVVETPENGGKDLLLTSEFLKECLELYSAPSRGFETNPRVFPVRHLLESNFRRSNGTGLVCLEKRHDDGTKTPNHDEFASDVEKAYRILRKFHSRVPKLELALNESGVELRPGLIERVLNRCGDAGSLGYRFFVWAAKQRPGYRHSYQVYKSMAKIISKMRQFGAVWSLIEEMRKENPQLIESELFVVLVRRFEGSEIMKKAVEVLDEMPEPDEYVFACLLDALCKSGSVKDAAKLFEDMRLRFGPDRRYFASLLCGWCREGRMMEAKHVLVQMKEAGFDPDVVDYTNLLSGYAHASKMADSYDVLKDMRRRGFEPKADCYTVLIQALCKVDRMEEAMSVFVEMERYECEADTVTYTELVSGFCKSGKIDKCYSLLDDMIKKGLVPSQLTYMHIMAAYEKRENLDECLELMEKMKMIGYHLDLDVYNVVIRLACKLGEVKEAVRLWNEMEADGLRPEVDTFVIMINGLTSRGCLLEACEHFKEMVSRGLFSVPQHVTLKSLLNSVLREEKLEMAEDVWSCITSKCTCELNVSSWTIWIHALFSKGYVKEACSYCVEMIEMDFMMQPDTFAKLMKGLKKLYNREFAVEITEKVRSMAAEREMSFKMYKRRGVEDLTEKAKARKDRQGKKNKRTTP